MTPAGSADAHARPGSEAAGSRFVRELAMDVARGPVELPGFPDIAVRLQELLADENINSDAIVRIVGAEPTLAARVVAMANSAALARAGTQVADLRAAVARLGFDLLRAAALAYAVGQVARAGELAHVQQQLGLLWLDSVAMASTCSVIARHCGRVSTDKALFTGLVSGVGRIYILTRAAREPALLADAGAYQSIQEEWHLRVAHVLVESWHVADEVIEALQAWPGCQQEERTAGALADVLATASFLDRHAQSPETIEAALPEARAVARLGLTAADCLFLLRRADEEMGSLRSALGY